MTKTYNLRMFSDGGSRGNPGPAAYGYVIYDDAGNVLEKCGNYLGETTNNQAEYQGLIAGVKWVAENHPQAKLEITMDSLLIVNQIKGIYKVKHPAMKPLYMETKKYLSQLAGFTISHTLRGGNKVADELVNQALDSRSKI